MIALKKPTYLLTDSPLVACHLRPLKDRFRAPTQLGSVCYLSFYLLEILLPGYCLRTRPISGFLRHVLVVKFVPLIVTLDRSQILRIQSNLRVLLSLRNTRRIATPPIIVVTEASEHLIMILFDLHFGRHLVLYWQFGLYFKLDLSDFQRNLMQPWIHGHAIGLIKSRSINVALLLVLQFVEPTLLSHLSLFVQRALFLRPVRNNGQNLLTRISVHLLLTVGHIQIYLY